MQKWYQGVMSQQTIISLYLNSNCATLPQKSVYNNNYRILRNTGCGI